jgi:hypothetical protein
MPLASPAANAAIASDRLSVAAIVIACTASAAASPVMSLSGRTAVNQ